MEAVSGRSSGHGGLIKEEKRDNSNGDEEEGRRGEKVIAKVGSKRKGLEVELLKPSSPKQKDFSSNQVAYVNKNEGSSVEGANSKASSSTHKDQDDYELESAKAEMGEVREENQRLRMYLDRMMKDYQTLQMKFHDIVQQESKRSMDTSTTSTQSRAEEPEFVSLSLGRTSSTDSKKLANEKNKTTSSCKLGQRDEQFKHGLALGLDCKFEEPKMRSPPPEALPNSIIISPENSSFEEPREEASETNWPPNKIQKKTMTSGEHDEILQQNNNVKKTRVSVRARCDTPTMNDGCQWRKYGQKIAKGNPCPRAYYRCTVAPSCPVRKQVQRCAQDMSILITTYEGTHNHPLPIAATAMASTTSAAASMLLSGSSSSRPGLVPSGSANATTTTTADHADQLHGLNFYLSENSKAKQFYFPNSSISSSPASYPTVTLDLTSSSSSSSSFSSHFNRLSSSYQPTPRFSSLNFSSTESNTLPISWSNGQLTYGNTTPSYNKNTNNIASINLGTRQSSQESNFYQSYMQKNNNPTNISQQSLLPDTAHNTIAAATKAITSDPTFQSALAAALTSIIGASPGNLNQGGLGENFGQKLKWGDQFLPSASSTYQSTPNGNGNGCGSSYLNNRPSSSSNPQSAGSLMFLPPSSSLPFPSSKSASTSPSETRDQSS